MYSIEIFLTNNVDYTLTCENYTVTENWLCCKESEDVQFWYNREHIKNFIVIKKEDKEDDL